MSKEDLCTCYGGTQMCNKTHAMDPFVTQFGRYPAIASPPPRKDDRLRNVLILAGDALQRCRPLIPEYTGNGEFARDDVDVAIEAVRAILNPQEAAPDEQR